MLGPPASWIISDNSLLGPRAFRPQRATGAHFFAVALQSLFALRAHCGRDARGPSKELTLIIQLGRGWHEQCRSQGGMVNLGSSS